MKTVGGRALLLGDEDKLAGHGIEDAHPSKSLAEAVALLQDGAAQQAHELELDALSLHDGEDASVARAGVQTFREQLAKLLGIGIAHVGRSLAHHLVRIAQR